MSRSRTRARIANLALGLTIGLAPGGCVAPRRADVGRRELDERVAGPGREVGRDGGGPGGDPSLDRASAEAREGPAAGREAAAIRSGPLTLEDARGIALRSSPVLAQSNAS